MVLMIMLQKGRRIIIAYNIKGHTMCFDGYGPEHNETIKSLRKAIERGEVKFLSAFTVAMCSKLI